MSGYEVCKIKKKIIDIRRISCLRGCRSAPQIHRSTDGIMDPWSWFGTYQSGVWMDIHPMASIGCKMVAMLHYVCVLRSMPCIYRAYSTSTLCMLQYFTYFHTLLLRNPPTCIHGNTMTLVWIPPGMTSRGRDLRSPVWGSTFGPIYVVL